MFLAVMLVLLGVALFLRKVKSSNVAIATAGGEQMEVDVIATPHFKQTDPRWAGEVVGGSKERIGRVGCTICCVAMALHVYGLEMTPLELNKRLQESGGYTSSGLLKWDAVPKVSEGKVKATYIGPAEARKIDAALKEGNPVIAKIMLNNVVQHWVLIVGKHGTEYLVRDPGHSEVSRLSGLANKMYAIRILGRV